MKLAEDPVRFAKDQFVIWEKPLDIAYKNQDPVGIQKIRSHLLCRSNMFLDAYWKIGGYNGRNFLAGLCCC